MSGSIGTRAQVSRLRRVWLIICPSIDNCTGWCFSTTGAKGDSRSAQGAPGQAEDWRPRTIFPCRLSRSCTSSSPPSSSHMEQSLSVLFDGVLDAIWPVGWQFRSENEFNQVSKEKKTRPRHTPASPPTSNRCLSTSDHHGESAMKRLIVAANRDESRREDDRIAVWVEPTNPILFERMELREMPRYIAFPVLYPCSVVLLLSSANSSPSHANGYKELGNEISNSLVLDSLIRFTEELHRPLWQGALLALTMFTASELSSLLLNHYYYLMYRVGTRIQSCLTAAIYKKTLRLSNASRREKTVGEMVNLMAINIDRFQQIAPQMMQYWSTPLQISHALFFLCCQMGMATMSMLFMLPCNFLISMMNHKYQVRQMRLKDKRTKMVNEVLNGIKVIKLYAWVPPMEGVISNLRDRELSLIRKAAALRTFSDMLNTASPFLVAFSTFATFLLFDPKNVLTPQIAFVSLTLFNQLRPPMSTVAGLISQTVQVVVSNRRLKEFIVAGELNPESVDYSS